MKDTPYRRFAAPFLPLLLAAALVAGCGDSQPEGKPAEITKDTTCSLDGMVLSDFPGPKGQILYDGGERAFFCDTKELVSQLLRPEEKKRLVAAYTQDMAHADWNNPNGYWVDAKKAFYVVGSKREGSMGPTLATFAREEDAQAFAAKYGGKVLPFGQVTLDMVDLSGGAVHDQKM